MDKRDNHYRDYVKQMLGGDPVMIFFDTETEGLKHHAQIIEFAAVAVKILHSPFRLQPFDKVKVYIKPYSPLIGKIEELTGITNDFLCTQKYEEGAAKDVFSFIDKYPNAVFVGYNVRFDLDKLDGVYQRQRHVPFVVESIDVLQMAKDCLADMPDYKLGTVAGFLDCVPDGNFHDALADTEATIGVFEKCIELYNQSYKKERNKKDCVVNYAFYWKNQFQGKMQRIVCDTSMGRFYYDIVSKQWGMNRDFEKKAGFSITSIDLDSVVIQLRNKYHVKDMDELVRLLKEKQRKAS